MPPHLALPNVQGFSHACEFSPQRNQEKGTFKAYKETHQAYVEQCKGAKQAKVTLALLTAPISKGKKASEKASKKEPGKNSSEKDRLLRRCLQTNPLRRRRLLRRSL